MQLGQKIKKLRELKNLTQQHVSEQIGYSQSSYSKIESGSDLSFSTLERIAEVLQVQVTDIICFNEKQIIFNMSHNQMVTGVEIKNQVSQNERKLYDALIEKLKEEILYLKNDIVHLKSSLDKLLKPKK